VRYLLAIILLCAGCSTFQATPRPQSGGSVEFRYPAVRMTAPDNADSPSSLTLNGDTLTASFGINQHDKARDDWAAVRKLESKLKSYGSVRLFGFALLLAALAMFHPVVRTITGATGQIATGALGLALVFGGSVVAGNETLIILTVTVALALYLFARRHGQLQGMLDTTKPNQ
jgi:hypothetical protein